MNPLSYSDTLTEQALSLAIVECGRICYERHLMASNDGNISVRVNNEQVLITPSGICKGRMEVEDLLTVDLNGKVLQADPGRKSEPSSETPMHLEAYKQRPDVRAVIHAHPVFATVLTVAGMELPSDVLPEVMLTLGKIPTSQYATPSSHEDAEAIRELIKDHDAILLRQHGSLTVGKDLEEALINLERLEHVAEVAWRAQLLGEMKRIPLEALVRMLIMQEMGKSK
jgi:L-fuculose-phosphate aldolase